MRDYIICTLFWCTFIIYLYLLGNSVDLKKECQSIKFVKGYLVYSFFSAIGGIVTQVFKMNYLVYNFYMIIIILITLGSIIYIGKKRKSFISGSLKEHILCNWFLVIPTIILCTMLFCYYRAFWYGNHLDDGYYLTKVAVIAQGNGDYISNIPVGMGNGVGISYLLSTWEIESAFYIKILHVTPSLFLRFFQSGFNYFLFFNCVLAFGNKIVKAIKKEYKERNLQYVVGVCLVFFVYYVYLQDTQIFFLRDMHALNTAMFYGSSIAKMTVVMCLLMFYLEEKDITLKMIFGVIGISIAMVSKSCIVLPLIVVTSISYIIVIFGLDKKRKVKVIGGSLLVLSFITGYVIPNNQSSQNEVYQYAISAIRSPIVIIAVVIFVGSFFLRNKMIYKINVIFILIGAFFIIPQLNDISEMCAVYTFVAGRAWSTYVYTFVILNLWYLYLGLDKIIKSVVVKLIFIFLTCATSYLVFYGYEMDGKELFVTNNMPAKTNADEDFDVLYRNHKFEPDSAINLGNELEKLENEKKEKLLVLTPEWAQVDDTLYTLSVQLRSIAPNVISVSAMNRYKVDENCMLYGYEQKRYDNFVNAPSDKTAERLNKHIIKYGINCIVVQNKECGQYLKKIGFKQEAVIQGGVYYVWYKSAR